MLVFSILLLYSSAVYAKTITRVVDWPGYKTQRACVQTALREPTSSVYIGCKEYVCGCNHFDVALSLVSSAAREACTSMRDVEDATSIIKGFCAQFPGVTATIVTDAVEETGTGVGGGNGETQGGVRETQVASIARDLSSGVGFKVILCVISGLLLGVISLL